MADDRTPLEKNISKAFDYFPFGFEKVQLFDKWACGPVFMARVPDSVVALNVLAQPSGFKQDELWETKAKAIIDAAPKASIVVTVDKNGHPMERMKEKDKNGAWTLVGPSKCTGRAVFEGGTAFAEFGFPLFALGRTLRVVEYRMEAVGSPIYGFSDDGLLVVTLAPRLLDAQCRP